MKAISLKIREDIFEEAEKMVKEIHVSRNAYINKALEFYNKINRRRKLRAQFKGSNLSWASGDAGRRAA